MDAASLPAEPPGALRELTCAGEPAVCCYLKSKTTSGDFEPSSN